MSRVLLLAFLLTSGCPSFAETKVILSLHRALDAALLNFPALKAKQFQVESARASVTDARDQVLPALTLSDQLHIGTDNGLGGSYFPMGIIPSTSGGIRPENISNAFAGNIAVAYLQHELYNFGLNGARIESASSLVNYSTADYAESTYLLQYHVAQLYFELLRYRLLVNVQQNNIDRYRILYNYIRAYTGSGIKPGVDSSIANAEVSKAEIQLIQTTEAYDKLKHELMFYTGLASGDFEIDTTIYHLPAGRIGLLKEGVSGDSVSIRNPVLAFYNSRWEYAQSQENLTEKSYLPKIYLVGSVWARGSSIDAKDAFGNLSTGLDYSRYNYLAGVALTYDIFNILHRNDKTAVQHYQSESMREDVEQQRSLMENQLGQADIAIEAVSAREKEIPLLLKAARDVYLQKSAQYDAGLANIIELTDASYLLYKAETDEVELLPDLLNTLLNKAVTNNTLNAFLSGF